MTIKQGSSRVPGNSNLHVEIRDSSGGVGGETKDASVLGNKTPQNIYILRPTGARVGWGERSKPQHVYAKNSDFLPHISAYDSVFLPP